MALIGQSISQALKSCQARPISIQTKPLKTRKPSFFRQELCQTTEFFIFQSKSTQIQNHQRRRKELKPWCRQQRIMTFVLLFWMDRQFQSRHFACCAITIVDECFDQTI
mmetsp:Transcript_47496/g.136528  ORF Transcript_47496/g.136528 Transcript_47496/m.136528 type:complete len:109 (+) Transcript_47496:293-619(+)